MGDCSNAVMRDQLPDLVHGRLSAVERQALEAHLATCAECRAELALVRQVAGAFTVPPVDASRIVARLAPHRPSLLARATRSWALRAAAAVVLVAGSATVLRDRAFGPDTLVATASVPPEVSVGPLSDISDDDLQALVDELNRIEAVPSTEPDVVVVPAVGRGSD